MKHIFLFLIIPFFFANVNHSCSQGNQISNYQEYILTPPPPETPRITGPHVYGVKPGSPFLFKIPCTGERPIRFAADRLPAGLKLDPENGIITGSCDVKGSHKVQLIAQNQYGKDAHDFTIKVGDKLALTPPMGWNSWYIHYDRISDVTMREAADQMINTGMADYGYQYVNIDDCWMRKLNSQDLALGDKRRDESGIIIPNDRFPDMSGMTDYIHAKGLKAGLYISPGLSTCAGYEGSYMNEALDAKTFADWSFDFLKYDWCSYSKMAKDKTREEYMKPYVKMWDEVQKLDRDIVLNLCQYGMGDVWKWGGQVGHCWRTTGDLGLERGKELPGFYYIGFSNAQHWKYAKPGEWNDPDYILIGWVGDAHKKAVGTPTTLTPYEQYSYMSMWCLMAAPLIFSGDMAKLDDFTLNVLCNHEVIEVDQDPMGIQGKIIRHTDTEFVLAKEMEDGSMAVGIFNLGENVTSMTLNWVEIDIKGQHKVRDLWHQKEIGSFDKSFETEVPPHGVSMIRIWKQ